ncbi:MAG TPA: hypothetical protein VMX33_12975 [bacterium]|nr:hypothetical protein [bacterium]
MKRSIIVSALFLLAAGSLFAQTRLDAAAPKDARTMAMGGAFVAMSQGYQSLYGNPATYADKTAELTLMSVTPWVYVRPTTDTMALFQNMAASISSGSSSADDVVVPLSDLITDNGFGGGISAGLGWVGKGLGLGLIGSGEAYVHGDTLLGATGRLDGQISAIVGVGAPLQLGPFRIQIGGDVRPYLRATGPIVGTDLLGLMTGEQTDGSSFDAMSLPVDLGFGLAVDLGARIDFGTLASVGLAVRDISTKQNFSQSTLGDVLDSLGGGALPAGTTTEYPIYPNVTLGASLSPIPVRLRSIVDVTLIAEIQDPVNVYMDRASIWNVFHAGVETNLLGGLFALRGGINKGWLSLGAGFHLLVMQVNVAVFTEELGPRPGDQPRTGVSVEAAIRF